MKNLKLFLMSVVAMFVAVVGVHATTIDNLPTEEFEKTPGENGVITIKLLSTTSENLEIGAGEKVILDLNGKMLSNDNTEDMPTIRVATGGELTITSTSESGYPAISRSNKIEGSGVTQPVIRNDGILTLEDGNILSTEGVSYVVDNSGNGRFTMNGGSIGVTDANIYAIKNNGIAIINGGRITTGENANYTAILNHTTGQLTITGGTFLDLTGKNISSLTTVGNGTITVTGGQFEYQDLSTGAATPQDVSEYIPDDYEVDRYGNVVEVKIYTVEVEESEYGKLTAIQTEAKEGGSITIKVEPNEGYRIVKVYYDDVEIEVDAEGNYTFLMPGKNVTVKAEFELISVNTEDDGNETDDNKGGDNNNNNNNTGATAEDKKTSDTEKTNQNQTENKPADENKTENPGTLDSIVSIVTLAITSLGTAGYSIKKFIRR